MQIKLILPFLLAVIFSHVYSDQYVTTATFPATGDFVLTNNGTAVGLEKDTFYRADEKGLQPITGFPPSSPFSKFILLDVNGKGDILMELGVGSGTTNAKSYAYAYPIVYTPEEGAIQLLQVYRSSSIGSKEDRETALPVFSDMQMNENGSIVGTLTPLGKESNFFLFDIESMTMTPIEAPQGAKPVAINAANDVLFLNPADMNFTVNRDDVLKDLKDLGLAKALSSVSEKEVVLVQENLIGLNLLKNGSITGLVKWDDKQAFFLADVDGTLYISGVTDKNPLLTNVSDYDVCECGERGIIFSSSDGLYRFNPKLKAAEKVILPPELTVIDFEVVDGKILALTSSVKENSTVKDLVIWQEGVAPVKLIDMMEDKSFADDKVSDDDYGIVNLNDQGDLLLKLTNDDVSTYLLLSKEVAAEVSKEASK